MFCTWSLQGNDSNVALPENYHSLSKRISSSGEPVADEAFAALAREGVKTVVSVDGAPPDLRSAARHGIRYVHLPIGYDGVPAPTIAAMGLLLTETEGRVLIHCHHGKHRGPAAAVIACMIEGSMNTEEAMATLEAAGTSHDYAGLRRDVKNFAGVPRDVLAAPLKATVEANPLATDMVGIDRALDALAKLSNTERGGTIEDAHPAAGWNEQSALLVEGFREAARHLPESLANRDEFQDRLTKSLRAAERLRDAAHGSDRKNLHDALAAMKNDCRSCHRKFRD